MDLRGGTAVGTGIDSSSPEPGLRAVREIAKNSKQDKYSVFLRVVLDRDVLAGALTLLVLGGFASSSEPILQSELKNEMG